MVLTSDLDGKFSPKRGFRPFFLTVLFLRWGRLLPEVIQILTSDLDGKFSPKRGFRLFFLTVLFLRWGRLLPEVIQILTSFLTVLFLLRWELLLPEVIQILTSFLTSYHYDFCLLISLYIVRGDISFAHNGLPLSYSCFVVIVTSISDGLYSSAFNFTFSSVTGESL